MGRPAKCTTLNDIGREGQNFGWESDEVEEFLKYSSTLFRVFTDLSR